MSSSTRSNLNGAGTPEMATKAGGGVATAQQETPLQQLLVELRDHKERPGSRAAANVSSAFEAINGNKGRSFLTGLGIFIGIAAVIAAVSLTQGVNLYISNILSGFGSLIIVYPSTGGTGTNPKAVVRPAPLTIQDAESISHLAHLAAASPVISISGKVIYQRKDTDTTIQGVNASFEQIQNTTYTAGGWFTQDDDNNGAQVAVIGDTIKKNLFDPQQVDPLGQTILISGQRFKIVGVMAQQGPGIGSDDVVIVPFKTAHTRLRTGNTVDQIELKGDSTSVVDQAASQATQILQQQHHITGKQANNFTVLTFTQFLQQAGSSAAVEEALLIGIAAISLTVGGIGIMNIMLVSVTERTWEIGIRMAIGARRKDIRNQFLVEALFLCILSGVFGMLLGLLVGKVVTNLGGLPFVVDTTTIVLPFIISAAIALLFGLYPAIRASRLDPIVAIRSEE